jgi:hypothetical protein
MHDIQSPRRRRDQTEIDQLVREFRDFGLNQQEFAQKVGVHPLTGNGNGVREEWRALKEISLKRPYL